MKKKLKLNKKTVANLSPDQSMKVSGGSIQICLDTNTCPGPTNPPKFVCGTCVDESVCMCLHTDGCPSQFVTCDPCPATVLPGCNATVGQSAPCC